MDHTIIHTQNDGNCLFEALCIARHMLDHPGERLPAEHLEQQKWDLRQTIAHIVCVERRDHFSPFCPHPHRMRESGEWAGHHELVAFSDHFETNIVVHDQNDDWDVVVHIPSEALPHPRTITLRREGKTHYNLVCDRGTLDPRILDLLVEEARSRPAAHDTERGDRRSKSTPWWKKWLGL